MKDRVGRRNKSNLLEKNRIYKEVRNNISIIYIPVFLIWVGTKLCCIKHSSQAPRTTNLLYDLTVDPASFAMLDNGHCNSDEMKKTCLTIAP
jgi:hypothetical protein